MHGWTWFLSLSLVVVGAGCPKEDAKPKQPGEPQQAEQQTARPKQAVNPTQPKDKPQEQGESLEEKRNQVRAFDAIVNLGKLKAAASAYFNVDHYDKEGSLLPKGFPPGNTDWVPPVPCCKQKNKECQPKAAQWEGMPWVALYFKLTEPDNFQYRYSSKGQEQSSTFVIEARGDPGCIGKPLTYRVTGSVDSNFNVKTDEPTRVP